MGEKPLIVVCGATGNQGGAVATALLSTGRWRIGAVLRNPDRGRALAERGVEILRGDLLDHDSLISAFAGATAVFGVTQPWSADYKGTDIDQELRQGRALCKACAAAGVTLIFSSVLVKDDQPTGTPHVDSKLEIEADIRQSQLPAVILGPSSFMDNLGMRFFPIRKGEVRGFTDAEAKLPLVACRDIGRAVSAVLTDLDAQVGRRHNLISGMYSGVDICTTLSRLRYGEEFRFIVPSRLLMQEQDPEFYKMRQSFEQNGKASLPPHYEQALRGTMALIGRPTTLEDFLREKGYAERDLA